MDISEKPIGLGEHLKEELPISERCLEELRKIQKKLVEQNEGQWEFFDFGLGLQLDSEKTIEGKLQRLIQACIWHSVALKITFKLKLLYTIDGYLSAVDVKNPVSTFLMARYLLELVATVNAIDVGLRECLDINMDNWMIRGTRFLGLLYRARHSTTDDNFKSLFVECGIPTQLVRPIKIGKAIKMLASRHGFSPAVSIYHTLSNICHHNGSAPPRIFGKRRGSQLETAQPGP